MRKYITRAAVRYSEQLGGETQDHPVTVYEPDDTPRYTGLLDAQGNDLYAVEQRNPIGFRR